MAEGAEIQMPLALRRLFATLLVFCDEVDALSLWQKFYSSFSEDYAHKYKEQPTKVMTLTYRSIAAYLKGVGKTMADYNLNFSTTAEDIEWTMSRDVSDAMDTPIPPEYMNSHTKLNSAQRATYDSILYHAMHDLPGAFFIDGSGGTGKTFLYCTIYAALRLMGKIILPTATSGIAASNLPSGRTAHSRFKISIAQQGLVTCNVSKPSALANLLKTCCAIIWDEASMANKEDIEALDRMLQDIWGSKLLFGGKIVIFGRDFRQVLPVVPHKSQLDAVNASLVNSYLWPRFIRHKLETNIRANENMVFGNFLLRLGNGEFQQQSVAIVTLPAFITSYIIEKDTFEQLIKVIYPELEEQHFDSTIFTDRAILTPTNEGVDNINISIIAKFPGSVHTYISFDSIVDDNCNLYATEFLNSLCPSCMAPHLLP